MPGVVKNAESSGDEIRISAETILTINGGSSSIKFAVFESTNRVLSGEIERIGHGGAFLSAKGLGEPIDDQPIDAADQAEAADHLIDWLGNRLGNRKITGIGHRVVHGGLHLLSHQLITAAVLDQLRQASEMDPSHLPREIALIEAFAKRYPGVPQAACFDTAFFKDLPTVARLLPIPRKYLDEGFRRFGFHGLSYTYLLQELRKIAGDTAADGKVILAHLGNGASITAAHRGQPIDTSMSFTPIAGLMMGTRPGDLDPGLLAYILRNQKITPDQLDEFLNERCGLRGVSGTSGDMRDLLNRRATDTHAAEAVDLFCYQVKTWIGGFAASLGGIDTLIFAGGIGERSFATRAGICAGLEFLGIAIDAEANQKNAAVISSGAVTVRVIATNEEQVIAQAVGRLVGGV
jgi:acetate kinase